MVEDLISQGIVFIIGKGAEIIDPLDIKNLLVRESNEKLKIGKGTQELGLIERLALAGVKGYSEIADALGTLGLLDFGGDKSHVIRRYVMSRWGKKYRSFNKFIAFLKTSFLRGEDN